MGRSLIQVVNQSDQNVAENGVITLGTVQRRYGTGLRLSGNGIEATGRGYYSVNAAVAVAPTAAGHATVALYDNGAQVPGAIAYGTAAAGGDLLTLPIVATLRRGCCCEGADNITLVLVEGAGVVSNVSMRITEE